MGLSCECEYNFKGFMLMICFNLICVFSQVTSPYGNILHHNENATQGQFAFTAEESGNYEACFWMVSKHKEEATLSLEWKTGIAAKDWESVAKKEKIEVNQ